MGFVYLRDHKDYINKNIIKMGITSNIINRESTYITGEYERGFYNLVIEIINNNDYLVIDNKLKYYFKNYNDYKGGGTEFYNRCIIDKLLHYITRLNIKHRVLTYDDIDHFQRKAKFNIVKNKQNIIDFMFKFNIKYFISKLKSKNNNNIPSTITPNNHQQYVLNNIRNFYHLNDIGKIIWACGLGKALLSILITRELHFKRILIGVPSIHLQKQMIFEILKVFNNKSNILCIGDNNTYNLFHIKQHLNNIVDNQPKFIITTYNSCHKFANDNIHFDFKIGDEAHHLANKQNSFTEFHNIVSNKSLFMTATEKTIISNQFVYSMDDVNYFGHLIDCKSISWAIDNHKITDYNIMVLENSNNDINQIINDLNIINCNKLLLISCFMSLKSFNSFDNLSHILLYTNTIDDAMLCKKYIDILLSSHYFNFDNNLIYNNDLHSNKSNCNIQHEINVFKSKQYGIISCVSLFGEGFDLPKLNGVCIACNMQSEIRIVQYLLRPNRLDINNPNKLSHIIIPSPDLWLYDNYSYNNIKYIIEQFRSNDHNIEHKIRLFNLNLSYDKSSNNKSSNTDYLNVNNDHLNKLKLRLKHSNSLISGLSYEQDLYNYIKEINKQLHLHSKEEYVEKKDIHDYYQPDPNIYFKSIWINWYHFLGFDTSIFIQDINDWKSFCKEKNINSVQVYKNSCKLYPCLPYNPDEFYKHFTTLCNELDTYDNNDIY